MTKITCISDLHGFQPELPGGDLLIVAGDLTARSRIPEYEDFLKFVEKQDYKKTIVVPGNHDTWLNTQACKDNDRIDILIDDGTEFEGLNIWGSPWSLWFQGINPECAAYTRKYEDDLKNKWDCIPQDTDILVTHTPPKGILDKCANFRRAGSVSLLDKIKELDTRLYVFGHIHESHGKVRVGEATFINASHVNEMYRPVNDPITVELFRR